MKNSILFLFIYLLSFPLYAEYSVVVLSSDTGSGNGSAEVIADGRTGPYEVTVSNVFISETDLIDAGETTLLFENLDRGSYEASIVNAYGCVVVIPFQVSECAVEVSFYLEGPFDEDINRMNTGLYDRGILPGQTPVNPLVLITPGGQPYNTSPWDYEGTEGLNWTDDDYLALEEDPVDWALLSIIDDDGEGNYSLLHRSAGILDSYGNFNYTCPDNFRDITGLGVENHFRIKIEHRNHMGVMSPVQHHFTSETEKIVMDFRTTNSFVATAPDGSPASEGQKQIVGSFWAMHAGDSDQSDFPSYDINGSDKAIWSDENGIFDFYLRGDFDLNADVNGEDKTFWSQNNGKFSAVPKFQ